MKCPYQTLGDSAAIKIALSYLYSYSLLTAFVFFLSHCNGGTHCQAKGCQYQLHSLYSYLPAALALKKGA